MIDRSALRGYVLEELLARFLQRSGYSLLVRAAQDPMALTDSANGLRVRGRGAEHQVDVLGELDWPVPFSLPVRLFVEAKYRKSRVGLADVRNALGVVNDVNEHFSMSMASTAHPRPFRRYDYRYALFSASGFTRDAQQFAYTQQISLHELGGPAFRWLLDAADRAADELLDLARKARLDVFPVNQMRQAFRRGWGTWTATDDVDGDADDTSDDFDAAARRAVFAADVADAALLPASELARIAADLIELDGALYFGVTSAPFLLVVQPDDPRTFAADRLDGDGRVDRLAFAGRDAVNGEWVLTTEGGALVRFGLPSFFESLVLGEEPPGPRRVRRRAGVRTVTVLRETTDVTLRFEPVPAAEDDPEWHEGLPNPLRTRYVDPTLVYRDVYDRSDPESATWSQSAAYALVERLRMEGRPQAEVIVVAARHGGFVSRATVYEIAGYGPERTLRGFTRPVRRHAAVLQGQGDLPPDVAPALVAVYDSGVLATRFRVPVEFTQMVWPPPE